MSKYLHAFNKKRKEENFFFFSNHNIGLPASTIATIMRTVSCLYDSLGTEGTALSPQMMHNICKRTLDCSGIVKCKILVKALALIS